VKRITSGICVVLMAGCGGQAAQDQQAAAGGETPPAARVSACEVLPMAEVASVIGTAVQRTEPHEVVDPADNSSNPRYMTSCTYISERGQGLMTNTLMLRRAPETSDPATALNEYVEGVRREVGEYSLEPVAELSPGAGWHAETTTLYVYRPGWMISMAMDRNAPSPLDGAKQLTAKALEKLPGA
jgi:hypothetical protein